MPSELELTLDFSQFCQFALGSYSHQLNEMSFSIYKFENLVAKKTSTILDYEVTLERIDQGNISFAEDELYSTVGFRILLDRKSEKYLINFYLPSLIFVIVSWMSFLIPPDVIPGRMGLLIKLLLVLVNMFNTVVRTWMK